jgi:hypothetical protein
LPEQPDLGGFARGSEMRGQREVGFSLYDEKGLWGTSSRCKNKSLLQSAKEIVQCARINAIARAFLISTEGGCVAAILLLGNCWGTEMRKVLEYERQAAECRKLAALMKKPEQRKQLEDAADVWDRLARERRHGIVENNRDQAQPQTEK